MTLGKHWNFYTTKVWTNQVFPNFLSKSVSSIKSVPQFEKCTTICEKCTKKCPIYDFCIKIPFLRIIKEVIFNWRKCLLYLHIYLAVHTIFLENQANPKIPKYNKIVHFFYQKVCHAFQNSSPETGNYKPKECFDKWRKCLLY